MNWKRIGSGLLAAALATGCTAQGASSNGNGAAATNGPAQGGRPGKIVLEGSFEPADAHPLRVEVEKYSGPLEVVRLVPHGSAVNRGETVLEFDTEAIDEMLEQKGRELEQAREGLTRSEEESEAQRMKWESTMAGAELALLRSRRNLEKFLEMDKPQRLRQIELETERHKDRVENYTDELTQLEKMYREDDLVDETEEIVMKRAKRSLDRANEDLETHLQNAKEAREYDLPLHEKQLEHDLEQKEGELTRLRLQRETSTAQKGAELERTRRKVSEMEKDLEKLRDDRKQFVQESPADGILYYGIAGKWDAGLYQKELSQVARELRPEGRLPAGITLMTVVSTPKRTVMALADAGQLKGLSAGTKVTVRSAADGPESWNGRVVRVGSAPSPRGWFDKRDLYEVEIALETDEPGVDPGTACNVEVN